MKKSKSLSIMMAMMLAAQGGGAPAVFSMKGKIQDNTLRTLFFRPDLTETLKEFLPEKLDGISKLYHNPKFLKLLEENGCKVPELPIPETHDFGFGSEDQERIRKIIAEDNLELLQKESPDKIVEFSVIDDFFEDNYVAIPLLHYCVMKKAMKCFKFLLLNGVDPSVKLKKMLGGDDFYYDWDCMSIAVCLGEWEMMKILEERGINKFSNPNVWEAAALTHRNNLLQLFISNKDSINNNIFEECINVAMRGAVIGNNLKGATILISKGIDINAKDNYGRTPLHVAADKNSLQVAEQLISKGADINAIDNNGNAPLHFAAKRGSEHVAELLICKGADINAINNNGNAPLHYAAVNDQTKVAKLLISKGADINAIDNNGNAPLHFAAFGNSLQVAELLLSKGADINAKDNGGNTPLHDAAFVNSLQVAELLLSKGADINAKDNIGWTPLHVAASGNLLQVAELLLSKGADINAKDKRGKTPLHYAAEMGHNQLAELLLSK